MPDFTFQKSRCYASPHDFDNLSAALRGTNTPHMITIGGTTRAVCRFPDDRIWVRGTHESKELAWVKMSRSNTTADTGLGAPRPASFPLPPAPIGIPSDLLEFDPNIARDYEALAQAVYGPQGSTLRESRFMAPPPQLQDTVQRQDTARPQATEQRQETARPPATDQRQETARPTIAGPSRPQWRAFHMPSVTPPGLLDAMVQTWTPGDFNDIVCPDGQLRRFVLGQTQITATDLTSNTVILAQLS